MASSGKLWIVVDWHGDVVHARCLTRGQSFSLGTSARDWPFPTALLGAGSRTLVDYRDQAPNVWLGPGQWQRLTPGRRITTEIGPFCITTTMGGSDDDEFDLGCLMPNQRPLLYWVGSAAVHLALLVATFYSTPALGDVELPPSDEHPTWLVQQYSEGYPTQEDGPEVTLGIATEELPYAEQILGSASRCVGYETMGRRGATRTNQRYAVLGARDNPDPHISRQSAFKKPKSRPEPHDTNRIGIIGNDFVGDPDAPTAPWGRDTSLGTDEVSARGNMWGDAIGDSVGDGGLLKSSLDGGFVKRIEVVRSESPSASRPARVLHSHLSVHGSLPAQDVELAVAPRLAAFRDCYRADSSSHSDHEAHLELGLEIKSTGELSQIHVLKAERIEPTLLACVLASATQLTFLPQSGDSTVTYPLHFMPAKGEAAPPIESIAMAPAIPRGSELPTPCSGQAPRPTQKIQPCPR
jgi:hypothetical protein